MKQRELPMLAGIAGCLRWLEELAMILSGPLLTVGLGIALVDLLTDGRLLASQPALLYAWAISQSVGVDAQLVGSAAKTAAAVRARRPWVVAGYLALVVVLAYVAYVASLVFATQEAQGITTAAALARLGMDTTSWLWQRSGLAVLLVVLSGLLRYTPPADASVADERAQLERELQLEPLRAQVRLRTALGWRTLGGAIIQGAPQTPVESPVVASHDAPEPPLPTGPGTPVEAPDASKQPDLVPALAGVLRLPPPRRRRVLGAERRVRAALAIEPSLSVRQLAKRARVSDSTASKYRRIWDSERHEQRREMAQ